MKKVYSSICLVTGFILFSVTSFAANHIIEVEDFEFNPRNMSVNVGDSVTWQWHDGFHTTTSDVIPSGAVAWDAVLSTSSHSFVYVVSVPGTYSYFCTPHQTMGMTGSFVASGITDISPISSSSLKFIVFQNSADKSLSIKLEESRTESLSFSLMDLSGKVVYFEDAIIINGGEVKRIGLNIPNQGIYLAELRSKNNREVKRIVLN